MRVWVRTFVLVLVCLMAARAAEAQSYLWFEPQVALEKSDADKVSAGEYFGTLSFGHQWQPALGVYFESAHGNNWGETVIGPSFAIGEFQLVAAIGVEHYEMNSLRGRFNLYYNDAETGSFAYIDHGRGASGNWIAIDAVRMLGKGVGLGLALQMPGTGGGPKLELRAGDHLGLWIAPVYDWQEQKFRTLVGGRIMWDR